MPLIRKSGLRDFPSSRRKLFSFSQNRGHHARVAASVQYRDNPQGLFVRRIGDQVFTYDGEPQGREVRSVRLWPR